MKIHKLSFDDAFEEAFHVFAIYSEEEAYRLAFLLNQHLTIKLKKSDSVFSKKKQIEFQTFEYDHLDMFQNWLLIQNQSLAETEIQKPNELFSQRPTLFQQKVFLIKEFKKARFLLRVSGEFSNSQLLNLAKKFQDISQIYAIELVDLAQLKDKEILFF